MGLKFMAWVTAIKKILETMQPCRLEKPLSLAIAINSTIDKEYIYIIEKNPSLLFTLGWGVFQTHCFYDWQNGMVTGSRILLK